jgi:hypothetical protein
VIESSTSANSSTLASRFLTVALVLIGVAYTVTTIWALQLPGFGMTHMTDSQYGIPFVTQMAINRVTYIILCICLLVSSATYLRYPFRSLLTLIPALILLWLDGDGAYFDLLSNVMHISPDGEAFETLYNRLKLHDCLWYASFTLVLIAVLNGIRQRTSSSGAIV